MKVGQGNGCFIADAHDPRVSLAEMRKRWADGDYGKPRADYAQGWLQLAGRISKGQTHG